MNHERNQLEDECINYSTPDSPQNKLNRCNFSRGENKEVVQGSNSKNVFSEDENGDQGDHQGDLLTRDLIFTKQNGSKTLIPVISKQDGSKDLFPENYDDESDQSHYSESEDDYEGIEPPHTLQKQSRMKCIDLGLNRQNKFKAKMPALIKGVSTLQVKNIEKYDTYAINDPMASPSKKIAKSNLKITANEGDGDIWVEMIFRHKDTGKMRIMFVSKNTGKKVADEPPSGASKVIYLKESERDSAEKKDQLLDELDQLGTN